MISESVHEAPRRELEPLHELARSSGVLLAYRDALGVERQVGPDVLLAILHELGQPVERLADVPAALATRRRWWVSRLLPRVAVAWDGVLPALPLRLPKGDGFDARVELVLSNGEVKKLPGGAAAAPVVQVHEVGGEAFTERRLGLPAPLPLGYHRLRVHADGRQAETLIVSAPRQAWHLDGRRWGVFLPLYALTTGEVGGGMATFTDLERLARWTGELGGSVVGTLPLLAGFLSQGQEPFDPSPYNPASRLFWNELYVDPTAQPEHGGHPVTTRTEPPEPGRLVDYGREMAERRRVLEVLARRFFDQAPTPRREAFEAFVERKPEVASYAAFRAYGERTGKAWQQWDEPARGGRIPETAGDSACLEAEHYHLYVQWAADEQLSRLRNRETRAGAGLYLDLPLGVHASSFDVWRDRDLYATGMSAGAPPDEFFTRGQSWGFPPLSPEGLRDSGLRPWIEALRHHLGSCDVLRIDHAMQLERLFWIPQGAEATEGTYVQYPADELTAVLCLESHRAASEIVGENLGTVPPSMHDRLRRHRMAGMYVALFEVRPPWEGVPEEPLRPVPDGSLACVDTHDVPSFRAFWEERDLDLRRELGLLDEATLAREHERRRDFRRSLSRLLGDGAAEGDAPPAQVLEKLLEHLAASPAEWLLINLENLWGEAEPQNVPGTGWERPNWRRRAAWSFEDITRDEEIRSLLRDLDHLRTRQGAR